MDPWSHGDEDEYPPLSFHTKFDKKFRFKNTKNKKAYYKNKSLTQRVQKVVDRTIETNFSSYYREAAYPLHSWELPHNNLVELDENIIFTTQEYRDEPEARNETVQDVFEPVPPSIYIMT